MWPLIKPLCPEPFLCRTWCTLCAVVSIPRACSSTHATLQPCPHSGAGGAVGAGSSEHPTLAWPDLRSWLQQGTWPLSTAGPSPSWNCSACLQHRLHSFLKLPHVFLVQILGFTGAICVCSRFRTDLGFLVIHLSGFLKALGSEAQMCCPLFPAQLLVWGWLLQNSVVVGELLPYVPGGDRMGIFPLKVVGVLPTETQWSWIKRNGLLLTSQIFVIRIAMWNSHYPYFLFLFRKIPVTFPEAWFLVPVVPLFVRFTSLLRRCIFFSHGPVLPGNQGVLQVTTFTSERNNIDM